LFIDDDSEIDFDEIFQASQKEIEESAGTATKETNNETAREFDKDEFDDEWLALNELL
jgi:hypothetical protein